jgi:flagellar basal-body rod modification protein FlgD
MSLAAVANQQSTLLAAANQNAAGISPTTGATSTTSTSAANSNPLGTLSSNFSDFLNLLMTQLQNQDPTSPLDANQFTTELVQFSQVEQQINTNSSLGQLIQLTQAGDLTQASAMLGSKVSAQATQIPLQNGTGSISFTAPSAGPVGIAIYNAAGQQVRDASLTATAGVNNWVWDGKDNTGATLPDGAYNIAVAGASASGTTQSLPFTITGTATGVQSSGNSLNLNLGALTVPFTAVQSVTKS